MNPVAPKSKLPNPARARLCDRRSDPVHVSTALRVGLTALPNKPASRLRRANK